jgi:hypothetical protein
MSIKVLTSFCPEFCFTYVSWKHDIRLFDNMIPEISVQNTIRKIQTITNFIS